MSKAKAIDTLDEKITGEESDSVQISSVELDTLKWTLDTLTNLMKDIDERSRKTVRDLQDLQTEVNMLKSPISSLRKKPF
jgi:chromosome segregation ATPase